jgi:hypothetical protein
VIGIFCYLIARGRSMRERTEEVRARQLREQQIISEHMTAQRQPQQQEQPTPADQLSRLADLRQRGVLSAQEFEQQKAKVLSKP